MKKTKSINSILICILLAVLLFACLSCGELYEDDCDDGGDLCGDGKKTYQICCQSDGDCWYEVGDEKYYTTDYMLASECDWK